MHGLKERRSPAALVSSQPIGNLGAESDVMPGALVRPREVQQVYRAANMPTPAKEFQNGASLVLVITT